MSSWRRSRDKFCLKATTILSIWKFHGFSVFHWNQHWKVWYFNNNSKQTLHWHNLLIYPKQFFPSQNPLNIDHERRKRPIDNITPDGESKNMQTKPVKEEFFALEINQKCARREFSVFLAPMPVSFIASN